MTRTRLPNVRPNITLEALWGNHLITVTVGFDEQARPREVFCNTLRGGDMQAALADACVLISIALQYNVPPAALSKSLGRMPRLGQPGDMPASPIGTILECIAEASND